MKLTTDGWAGFTCRAINWSRRKDAPIVAKLKAAGAIIIGHTNMPDFANSDDSRSSSFGRTGNAYDVRFSPGGSSSGTVTSVTANMAMLGTGTDTANSIRMPAATSALVGVFPTRGLVPIAGIAPLDWMLDNTGPIARDVTDAAIALSVMAGKEARPIRRWTMRRRTRRTVPIPNISSRASLKGKRFGVPAFMIEGTGTPFHGTPAYVPDAEAADKRHRRRAPAAGSADACRFMKDLDELRAAGATIVMDDDVLPDDFVRTVSRVGTYPYVREGMEHFLHDYGPAQYHSIADYMKAVGQPIGANAIGEGISSSHIGGVTLYQREIENDPQAEANYFGPRRRAMAMYLETMDRLKLDAYVYPPIQMPPPDETLPQNGEVSDGPHSDTGWTNMLGVPAVVVSGGFYPGGLPVVWNFQDGPGATAICWVSLMALSRRRIIAIRRCWWSRDCWWTRRDSPHARQCLSRPSARPRLAVGLGILGALLLLRHAGAAGALYDALPVQAGHVEHVLGFGPFQHAARNDLRQALTSRRWPPRPIGFYAGFVYLTPHRGRSVSRTADRAHRDGHHRRAA